MTGTVFRWIGRSSLTLATVMSTAALAVICFIWVRSEFCVDVIYFRTHYEFARADPSKRPRDLKTVNPWWGQDLPPWFDRWVSHEEEVGWAGGGVWIEQAPKSRWRTPPPWIHWDVGLGQVDRSADSVRQMLSGVTNSTWHHMAMPGARLLFDGVDDHGRIRPMLVARAWWLAGIASLLPGCRLVGCARRRHRTGAGRCRQCGYDLRATPERCPECGRSDRHQP